MAERGRAICPALSKRSCKHASWRSRHWRPRQRTPPWSRRSWKRWSRTPSTWPSANAAGAALTEQHLTPPMEATPLPKPILAQVRAILARDADAERMVLVWQDPITPADAVQRIDGRPGREARALTGRIRPNSPHLRTISRLGRLGLRSIFPRKQR